MNSTLSLTSSVIVSSAMGYAPQGVPAKQDGVCGYCGLHIAKGDLCTPFAPSPAFMDDLSLAARGSELTCGHCAPLMSAEALRGTGHGVFTMNDVAPFRKWADIASALMIPPEDEPFVMTYATANNQHMAWRAPVNYSSERFYVRVGLRDLLIRHQILMEAVNVSERVAEAFGIAPTKKTFAHPFGALSSDLKEIGHASLSIFRQPKREDAAEHANKLVANKQEIDFLLNLTLGETWALRFLLSPDAGSD